MRRAEVARAKAQNATPSTLFEIDLLGVNDEARQGVLRFSMLPEQHIFLASHQKKNIFPRFIGVITNLSVSCAHTIGHSVFSGQVIKISLLFNQLVSY